MNETFSYKSYTKFVTDLHISYDIVDYCLLLIVLSYSLISVYVSRNDFSLFLLYCMWLQSCAACGVW